jgi:hypothetical protein
MSQKITKQRIIAERLQRQAIAQPVASDDAYTRLFRRLQPVSPIANTRPGSPPCLEHRTTFDDSRLTNAWRSTRHIIKGRFLHGLIGYIFQTDLETYANAFAKPIKAYSERQRTVLKCMAEMEPVTPGVIKEETGLLSKHIGPALSRLQEAFLVFEDQMDDDWEHGWELFENVWPDVEIHPRKQFDARKAVLATFLNAHVFATPTQICGWSGFPLKEVHTLGKTLEDDGAVGWATVDGLGEGWLIPSASELPEIPLWRGVRALSYADLLCRSHQAEIKERFEGLEVLCPLLIDGEFNGAIIGHWGFGLYPLDDIVVTLPDKERQSRKQEVLAAVKQVYAPEQHAIVRYDGKVL